jgi:hypothetical protein
MSLMSQAKRVRKEAERAAAPGQGDTEMVDASVAPAGDENVQGDVQGDVVDFSNPADAELEAIEVRRRLYLSGSSM